MIEQNFGSSLTVGVEEELWIIDPETLELVPAVERIVAGATGRDLPGVLKTELHASVVELNTDVCSGVAEAIAALRELRATADRIALAERHHPRSHLAELVSKSIGSTRPPFGPGTLTRPLKLQR